MQEFKVDLPILQSVKDMSLRDAYDHMAQRKNRGFIVSTSDKPVVVGLVDILPSLRTAKDDVAFSALLPGIRKKTFVTTISAPPGPLLAQPGLHSRFHRIFNGSQPGRQYAILKDDWTRIVTSHESGGYALIGEIRFCTCSRNALHIWLENETKVRGRCDYDDAQMKCVSA
jgi:hypothetical protein